MTTPPGANWAQYFAQSDQTANDLFAIAAMPAPRSRSTLGTRPVQDLTQESKTPESPTKKRRTENTPVPNSPSREPEKMKTSPTTNAHIRQLERAGDDLARLVRTKRALNFSTKPVTAQTQRIINKVEKAVVESAYLPGDSSHSVDGFKA